MGDNNQVQQHIAPAEGAALLVPPAGIPGIENNIQVPVADVRGGVNDAPINVDNVANRLFQRRVDAAVRVIPELSHPISLWSKKVRILLEVRGGLELGNVDLVQEILPAILTKLPVGLVSMVPRGSVDQALNFLELYDKAPQTIEGTFLQERSSDVKPSIHFAMLKQQYRETLRTDDDLILNRMSWETLKRTLPQQIKTLAAVIILEPGNNDQMAQLDRIWSDLMSSKDSIQYFNNIIPEKVRNDLLSTELFDNLTKKLDKLGTSFDAFVNQIQTANNKQIQFRNPQATRPSVTQSTSRYRPPVRNALPNKMLRAKSADNGRQYKYPHRLDFCFYHQRFGADALNCKLPCAFVIPNGNKENNYHQSKN